MKKEEDHSKNYRRKRIFVIVVSLLTLSMIYFFMNASFILRAISFAAFLIAFYIVDHFFQIHFEAKHYAFILIIGSTGLLLSPFYFIYPNYDKIQHFLLPILVSSIIFHTVSKLDFELKWKLAFTFFVTLSVLTTFEIGEYGLDKLFNLKLQGVYLRDISGLEKFNIVLESIDDTMIDISLGLLGSLTYVISYTFFFREQTGKRIFK